MTSNKATIAYSTEETAPSLPSTYHYPLIFVTLTCLYGAKWAIGFALVSTEIARATL